MLNLLFFETLNRVSLVYLMLTYLFITFFFLFNKKSLSFLIFYRVIFFIVLCLFLISSKEIFFFKNPKTFEFFFFKKFEFFFFKTFGFFFDKPSLWFTTTVLSISLFTLIFQNSYMSFFLQKERFLIQLNFFIISMVFLVLSNN